MNKKSLILFTSFVGAETVVGAAGTPHEGMKRYQIGAAGTYKRPWGDVTLTAAQFREAVDNFNKNARGTVHPRTGKPAVHWDYSHDMEGPAAGWIHDLDADGANLYAWTTWTPRAEKSLADEEFIGASMEIDTDYEDAQGKEWGTVLIGSALTNIPQIKDMQPIALSEKDETSSQENTVTIAELKKALKEASAEDRAALLSELLTLEGKPTLLSDHAAQGLELTKLKAKLTEGQTAAQTAEITRLSEELKTEKENSAKQAKAQKFSEMVKAGKAVPAQKDAYMAGDMDKFSELAAKPGEINLEGEDGTGAPSDEHAAPKDQAEAANKLHELAEKREREGKIKYSEALNQVRNENPKLAALADK